MARMMVSIVVALCAAGVAIAEPETGGGSGDTAGLHPRVAIETTVGNIIVELDAEKAPKTVLNFMQYVEDGFYKSTVLHRVVPGKLIQGGAYTPELERKTSGLRDGIRSESNNGLKNLRGTIAMYRVPNYPTSTTAEFFINAMDNPRLNGMPPLSAAYTVFGRVVDGMKTVDKIAAARVGSHANIAAGLTQTVPKKPVVIKSVKRLSRFDRRQAQGIIDAAILAAQQEAEAVRLAAKKMYEDRLAEILKKAEATEFTVTESGLKFVDLRVGTGMSPLPEDTVTIRLQGSLVDGITLDKGKSTPEDSVQRKMSMFIPGLREGLSLMREGGTRIMVIPPELGFGKKGIPGTIPSDSTLFFEVELLSVD